MTIKKYTIRLDSEASESLSLAAEKMNIAPTALLTQVAEKALKGHSEQSVYSEIKGARADLQRELRGAKEELQREFQDLYNGIATSLLVFLAQDIPEGDAREYLRARFPKWTDY